MAIEQHEVRRVHTRSTGYRAFHLAMMLVTAAALVIIATYVTIGVRERLKPDPRLGSMHLLSDDSTISDGWVHLSRTDDGILIDLATSGLPLGHVISFRAEIFNEPTNCTHHGRWRCGEEDLQTPDVGGSVIFLTSSFLLTRTTTQTPPALLKRDDASRALFGKGLTNPRGADVRIVVADHGVPVPGGPPAQAALQPGCDASPSGAGTDVAPACVDIQYAVYQR